MRIPATWILIAFASLLSASRVEASGRKVLPLDGEWQITQGSMQTIPVRFDHKIPVPGLCDLAYPAFTDVGFASGQRQAFWYRRTITVPGPRRGTALLKVNKAQFGTKVWVNGAAAGEHLACFTPGWFDVSSLIRYGQENTLVIRIGAYKDSLPPTVPTNTDYEQIRWIPGIYDSVSLHLMDGPYIESIQAAPRIEDRAVSIQVLLRNSGSSPARTPIKITVREWKSKKLVAADSFDAADIPASESRSVTRTISIPSARLWSPEDPFLYTARVETAGDSLETRFGMREFRFDAATGRAMLNGKPYYLRGTNFCMFRFFEDPLRGWLPWDRQWATKLLSMGRRAFSWNSARVCIAPFPEFWYDIADEQGWLLQDEFPIWGFKEAWSQEELTGQFKEWMRERWNHPSIAIWDACNETKTPRTGELIATVRGLDLSNRPWDDGYSTRHRPDDSMEDHPYRFSNANFKLEDLGRARGATGGLLAPPVLINEYGWLWLNRDGTPTTLTEKAYANNLGANAPPGQRREFYAYNLAALTEYWRARRQAAGVLHFCYLTYSRPGGQTSDHFVDMPNLVLEPHFASYMSDAFRPLAVMIDDFTARLPRGGKKEYPVVVTNDLSTAQRGRILLRVSDLAGAGRSLAEVSAPFTVDALGQTEQIIPLDLPRVPGRYRITAELIPTKGQHVISRRDVNIVTPAEARKLVNLARGCPVSASSEIHDDRGDCRARFATDGEGGTRWSSEFSDTQWLCVDLGQVKKVGRVELLWEAAYGRAYRIQASGDGLAWKDVYTRRDGKGGREELKFSPVEARYIRLHGDSRATSFGYSVWEFRVFEE